MQGCSEPCLLLALGRHTAQSHLEHLHLKFLKIQARNIDVDLEAELWTCVFSTSEE